jgi:hypothetical protein
MGDILRGALAAAEPSSDQVEGVASVGLGARRATVGAAVVAADEEVAGGQPVGRHPVQDGADLTRGGVEGVFGAVAVEADGVGAAAEPGELADKTREGAESGQGAEFGQRGRGCAGDDGLLRGLRFVEDGCRGGGCLAVSVPPRQFDVAVSAGAAARGASAEPRRRRRPRRPRR